MDFTKYLDQQICQRIAGYINYACSKELSGDMQLQFLTVGIVDELLQCMFHGMAFLDSFPPEVGEHFHDSPFEHFLRNSIEAVLYMLENTRIRNRIRKSKSMKQIRSTLEFFFFEYPGDLEVVSNSLGCLYHVIKPKEISEDWLIRFVKRIEEMCECQKDAPDEYQHVIFTRIACIFHLVEESPCLEFAKKELDLESMFKALSISKEKHPQNMNKKGRPKMNEKKVSCGGCQRLEQENEKFLTCARCKMAFYCCRGCQKADWKNGHKLVCKKYTGKDLFHIPDNKSKQ